MKGVKGIDVMEGGRLVVNAFIFLFLAVVGLLLKCEGD